MTISVQVDLSFSDEALHEVAQMALERKTGARALRSILENVLLDAKFMVPGSDIENIHITAACIRVSLSFTFVLHSLTRSLLLSCHSLHFTHAVTASFMNQGFNHNSFTHAVSLSLMGQSFIHIDPLTEFSHVFSLVIHFTSLTQSLLLLGFLTGWNPTVA